MAFTAIVQLYYVLYGIIEFSKNGWPRFIEIIAALLSSFLLYPLVFIFGVIIAYPFMMVVGLPTIKFLERKRYHKKTTTLIYLLSGTFIPALILIALSFIAPSAATYAAVGVPIGFLASFFTSRIMLKDRDDW